VIENIASKNAFFLLFKFFSPYILIDVGILIRVQLQLAICKGDSTPSRGCLVERIKIKNRKIWIINYLLSRLRK